MASYNYFDPKPRKPTNLMGNDPIAQIRMGKIFGQQPDLNAQQPDEEQQQPQSQDDPYLTAMMGITRNRPALSDYKKQLEDMPKEDDYQLGKMGKFGAALSGFAAGMHDPAKGYELGQAIHDSPYKSAMGEFNNKLAIRKSVADIEGQSIDDQIKAMTQARSMGLKYDEFKLKQLQEQREAEVARGNLDVNRGNLDVNRRKAATGDKTANATIENQRGMLAVAGRNAATGERNAGTNAQNANTNLANSKSLASYHEVMGTAATTRANVSRDRQNKPQSPYQQAKAVDLALSLLQRDRRWGKYIKPGDAGSPEPYLMAPDDGSPMYQEFRKQVRRHVENQLKSGTPFPGEPTDEGDEDIIDITPGGRR